MIGREHIIYMEAKGCEDQEVQIEIDVVPHPRNQRKGDKKKDLIRIEAFEYDNPGEPRREVGSITVKPKHLKRAMRELGIFT